MNKGKRIVDSSIALEDDAGIYTPVKSDGLEVMWGRPSVRPGEDLVEIF